MQILQWLFKSAHERERECNTTCPHTQRVAINDKSDEGKKDHIVLLKHHHHYDKAYYNQRTKRNNINHQGSSKLSFKNLKVFAFICGNKDIPKACFYRTLNISRIGNNSDRRKGFVNSVRMKSEELSRGVGISSSAKKADSASNNSHGGKKKKVLPITEASLTKLNDDDECKARKSKEENNGEEKKKKKKKKKSVSRMKELLRWAAAAKAERSGNFNSQKVLQLRRQGAIKATEDEEDQLKKTESPKISFTWERCSTISSIYSSTISTSSSSLFQDELEAQVSQESSHNITCRSGYWITTDSEFVVLEL